MGGGMTQLVTDPFRKEMFLVADGNLYKLPRVDDMTSCPACNNPLSKCRGDVMKVHWTTSEEPPAASIHFDGAREALVFKLHDLEVLALYRNGDVAVHGHRKPNDSDPDGRVFEMIQRFCTEVARAYNQRDDLIGRLRSWCNQFGEELTPPVGRADSYGEGVRDCKAAVGRILDRYGRD
jgi:hypothetical protein